MQTKSLFVERRFLVLKLLILNLVLKDLAGAWELQKSVVMFPSTSSYWLGFSNWTVTLQRHEKQEVDDFCQILVKPLVQEHGNITCNRV